jgi:hypothetical protein
MRSSISCRFTARVADVKVRQTKVHPKDFISLKVTLLDDPEGDEPVWVSTFHDVDDLRDALKQGQCVKIEGKIKPHRYTDSSGAERFILKVDADEIALVLTGQEKQKAKEKAKQAQASKQAAKDAQPVLALDEDAGRSTAGLCQGPAPPDRGKTYEWHETGGDSISDLF